ncbi:MAG TPA: type II secretion system minor pseudopilin GspK [Burkholderiales bacterium]|nr:type II secretion system minor pseudopilin GspK [Burkholderiales bacterium]
MKRRRSQQGLVLVTALLVVAIVAATAAYLGLGQYLWLRQMQNLSERSQADSMRRAALSWIGILLMREMKDGNVDHLGETWAKDLPPLPYEGGLIKATVSDATARLNLNNLVKAGKASAPDIAVFQKLLRLLDLNPALIEPVVDWIDPDDVPRAGGAEDAEYLTVERPYRAANQSLTSIDELRLIKGFTPEAVEKLRPYVVALPEGTSVNLNTAPPIVLAAVFPELAPSQTEILVKARADKPFTTPNDAYKLIPSPRHPEILSSVASAYFLVDLHIRYGRLQRSTLALLARQGSANGARVLWHHPQYPKLPSNEQEVE